MEKYLKKANALDQFYKKLDERTASSFGCCFRKLIPTNMNWNGTFPRQMVLVKIYASQQDITKPSYRVVLTGTDDIYVAFDTNDMEAGLAAYNDLVVVNTSYDLEYVAKKYNLEVDYNGWPSDYGLEETQENYLKDFHSTHSSVQMKELGIQPVSIIWPSDIYWT